jgi:hypothetical protein
MKKTFSNGFGSMDLTRDEYIDHWLSSTHQYATMFYRTNEAEDLIKFQGKVVDVAGKFWDEQE